MSLAWFRNVLPPRNRTQIDSSMLLSELENYGIVIIPSALSSRLCDAINLDFDRCVTKNIEAA